MSEFGTRLDADISAAELRIQQRKRLLHTEAERAQAALRSTVTSPSALLLAVGAGFTIGKLTEGQRAPGESRLARIWTAVSGGVGAALQVVRAPSLIWLAGLFGSRPEPEGEPPASPDLPPVV